MTIRAAVRGVGHYLPDRVVPNSEFEAIVDTSDEWIRSRSGIERRHFSAPGQTTADLGTRAAQAALADAGRGAIFHLRKVHLEEKGMTPMQIAGQLQCSEKNVYTMLAEAIGKRPTYTPKPFAGDVKLDGLDLQARLENDPDRPAMTGRISLPVTEWITLMGKAAMEKQEE